MRVKGPPELVPSVDSLAIAQRNQEQSPLLRLPAELRTRVYDYIFDSRSTGILHDDHNDWDRLEFSRTCRQIFAETARHYFENRLLPLSTKEGISCPNKQRLKTVFAKLTPSQKQYVNTVVLSCEIFRDLSDSRYIIFKTLPNLQILGWQPANELLLAYIRAACPDFEDIWSNAVRPYTKALVKIYSPQHEPLEL